MNSSDWRGEFRLSDGTKLLFECFSPSDLDAIYAIEKRAHPFPWRYTHFQDSLRNAHHHCVGVRVGHTWTGYAVVSCIAGEAEVLLLVVDRRWQGRGVGKSLLNHVLQCLSGNADTVFLEVRASNDPAIALYERLEFNQVGERPNYYRSAGAVDDALIFARVLE